MATRELIDTASATTFSVSRYADLNAAITAIGATNAYLLIDATTSTNGNVTVPDNVHTIFMEQADITGTDTITWDGPISNFEKEEVRSVSVVPDNITFPSIGKYIRIHRGMTVDVSEFGVRGVGDESTKVQNIMTAIGDKGQGEVYFPPIDGGYTMIDIQVPSGTKVRGTGTGNPFNLNQGTIITAASHTGEKAIFYVEEGGIDPQPTIAESVNFQGIHLRGPGAYNAQTTKGIWLKGAINCTIDRCTTYLFTQQGILADASATGFGDHRVLNSYISGAQAAAGTLSDYMGALEVHCGEVYGTNLLLQAGSNQNYPTDPDIYRCALLSTANASWWVNIAADQSDIGIFSNATGDFYLGCRTFENFGHGWMFDQYTGEGIGNGYTLLGCSSQDSSQHLTNTFDNLRINNADIGRMSVYGFKSIVRDSPTWVPKYGINPVGHAVGSGSASAGVDAVKNRNDFIGTRFIGEDAGTANWVPGGNLIPGDLLYGNGGSATDGDTTPSVANVSTLILFDSAPTDLTFLDDATPFQKVTLIDIAGNRTIKNGANFKTRTGGDVVMAAGQAMAVIYYNGTWGES